MAADMRRWGGYMSKLTALAVASALVAMIAALWATPALAVQALEGRTITGAAVASTDPTAVMEYDPNLNITWLRNWNANGAMNWNTAETWASALTVGAFSGWSLPSALNQDGSGPCSGFGCTGSPMGYMYYVELGNVAYPTLGYGMSNKGPFQNVQSNAYWSGTEDPLNPLDAWIFATDVGTQANADLAFNSLYAVAIRPGDVAAVPEPSSMALMMAGLGVVVVVSRRRVRRGDEVSSA